MVKYYVELCQLYIDDYGTHSYFIAGRREIGQLTEQELSSFQGRFDGGCYVEDCPDMGPGCTFTEGCKKRVTIVDSILEKQPSEKMCRHYYNRYSVISGTQTGTDYIVRILSAARLLSSNNILLEQVEPKSIADILLTRCTELAEDIRAKSHRLVGQYF